MLKILEIGPKGKVTVPLEEYEAGVTNALDKPIVVYITQGKEGVYIIVDRPA